MSAEDGGRDDELRGRAELVRQRGLGLSALLVQQRVPTVALHHRDGFGYTSGWVLEPGFAMTEQGYVYATRTDAWGRPEISDDPLPYVDHRVFGRVATRVLEGSYGRTYGARTAATGATWAALVAVVAVIALSSLLCGLFWR